MWGIFNPNKKWITCTSNFYFHHSLDASIAPVSMFLSKSVSLCSKSFHNPHSCLSRSHLFFSCPLVYSAPVRFLNPIMIFSQLFLLRFCLGLLRRPLSHQHTSLQKSDYFLHPNEPSVTTRNSRPSLGN